MAEKMDWFFLFIPTLGDFFAMRCGEILIHGDSQKPQAYSRICRGF